MATDPVCGMTIDPDQAAGSATYLGKSYWFCSAGCRSRFKADPASYAGSSTSEAGDDARRGGVISSLLKKLKGEHV